MADLIPMLFPDFEAYLDGPSLIISLIALGAILGFLTGFFGVGGGFLAVPMMNIALGIPYEIAVGSDVCFIIGTSSIGFLKHRDSGNVNYAAVINISLGSALGVLLGDRIQDWIHYQLFGGGSGFGLVMHSLFLVLLTFTLINMNRKGRTEQQGLLSRWEGKKRYNGALLFIGISIGTLTGLMGIGGGVLLVPVLILILGFGAETAVGSSLGIVLVSAIISTIKKSGSPHSKVSMLIVISLLVSSVIGVQLGAKMVRGVEQKKFSNLFSYIVVAAMVVIIIDFSMKILKL